MTALRDLPAARAPVVRLRLLWRGWTGVPTGGGVIFLCYHAMAAADRVRFARQLRGLRALGDLTSLEDALAALRQDVRGERRICLTFDDGAQSAIDHALPILVDHGAPATFFLVPGWIDAERPGIARWAGCRALASAGMQIGAHTMTHRRLATLTAAAVAAEFSASRARLQAMLGVDCRHCACPWGQPHRDYLPARDPALARAAGYRSFFTTVQQRARPGADPWQLPRVRMEPAWGNAELRHAILR